MRLKFHSECFRNLRKSLSSPAMNSKRAKLHWQGGCEPHLNSDVRY